MGFINEKKTVGQHLGWNWNSISDKARRMVDYAYIYNVNPGLIRGVLTK